MNFNIKINLILHFKSDRILNKKTARKFFMTKYNSLFLPKGSVRSILILLMTGWLLAAIWYQKSVPETVVIIWAGMIGWYFGTKLDPQT